MENINNITILGDIITKELLTNNKLKNLNHILEKYNGNDWLEKYYCLHLKNTYHRETAYINDLIEIIIITWTSLVESKIHNHPQNGCLMKLMSGSIIEEKYTADLLWYNKNIININDITYIEGNEYLHKIINNNEISCSLHIYSPPKFKANFF